MFRQMGGEGVDLPKPDRLTMTFFCEAGLRECARKKCERHFYWLSAKPDTLDWAHKQTPSTLRKLNSAI